MTSTTYDSNATAGPSEQHDLITAIRAKFASLARVYDMVCHEAERNKLSGAALVCLGCDAEELAQLTLQLRQKLREALTAEAPAAKPKRPATMYFGQDAGGAEDRPKATTFGGFFKRQAEELGLQPMPLEADLLISRVSQPGESGRFLADAFLSAYRKGVPFKHALFELVNLDAEGFRLFHQILHIRHVPGWDDDALYVIEQKIIEIWKGE